MNAHDLLRKVCSGHVMLVGEVRSAEIKESGVVDKNSGLKVSVWLLVYFVELPRENGFLIAKITRRVPRDAADPLSYPAGAERGKCYAFEVECVEWKHGFVSARMGLAEPEQIGPAEGGAPVAAPQGAGMGTPPLSLVLLQTTPKTP